MESEVSLVPRAVPTICGYSPDSAWSCQGRSAQVSYLASKSWNSTGACGTRGHTGGCVRRSQMDGQVQKCEVRIFTDAETMSPVSSPSSISALAPVSGRLIEGGS